MRVAMVMKQYSCASRNRDVSRHDPVCAWREKLWGRAFSDGILILSIFRIAAVLSVAFVAGCASLTNDAHVPVALSFSSGDNGVCALSNKRQTQQINVPGVASVRRSDDDLRYSCKTARGREAVGGIPSTMGGKIVASAVFLDLGITDAITDKHREYPASYVIPVQK